MDAEVAIELGRANGYLYSESRGESRSHHMSPDPEHVWVSTQLTHRETWRGWDGSGLIRERKSPARFFIEDGQRRWEKAGSPSLPSGLHQTVMAPGCMESRRAQERAARLPRDPAALRSTITRNPHGDPASAKESFSAISDLLRTPEASVELCRALYQIMPGLPDTVEMGELIDRAGRPGLALDVQLANYLHRLIFDPNTMRLLSEQETLTNPELDYAPVGTITGWTAYLREERVHSLPDDAPPIPGPPCLPGQEGIMREVERGLTQATGRPNK